MGHLIKDFFLIFFQCPEIVTSKQYNGCPLLNLQISTVQTRCRAATNPKNSINDFLNDKIKLYQEYLSRRGGGGGGGGSLQKYAM